MVPSSSEIFAGIKSETRVVLGGCARGAVAIGVSMDQSAKLVSLATSVPPHVLNQSDVASAASRGFAGRYDAFDRMARVFKSSGIRQRHAVRTIECYLTPLRGPARTSADLSR